MLDVNRAENASTSEIYEFTTPSESPHPVSHVIVITMQAILVLGICFGNGLVIISFCRCKKLQIVSNYFVLNLAIADFIVGAILPVDMIRYAVPQLFENSLVCNLFYASINQATSASVLTLLGVAFDRYTAIIYALHYKRYMTEKRALVAIVAIWFISIGFCFVFPLTVFMEKTDTNNLEHDCVFLNIKINFVAYYVSPVFFFIVFILVCLYLRMTVVARGQALRIHNQTIRHRIQAGNQGQVNQSLRNLKMFKTSTIILGLFFLCWCPFMVTIVVQVAKGWQRHETLVNTRSVLFCLALLNSAVNPIVYALRCQDFQTQFKKILCIS